MDGGLPAHFPKLEPVQFSPQNCVERTVERKSGPLGNRGGWKVSVLTGTDLKL